MIRKEKRKIPYLRIAFLLMQKIQKNLCKIIRINK